MNNSKILPVIVVSQFCCTSLWFASNAIMKDLGENFLLAESALGHLTSFIQFGFIIGTLVFAFLTIADRYSPSKVFLICAILGAAFNLAMIIDTNTFTRLLLIRFLTGFFLAGIYPVGMKIAADYFDKGLGKSLGFLVGALVLGTAFPHLLNGLSLKIPWKYIIIITSSLAVLGGFLMYYLVPNGPFRKSSQKFNPSTIFKVFENKNFRSAAFGYFGHMWELYAFWAFVPIMLYSYIGLHPEVSFNIPVLSFLIISIGGLGCVFGGYLSIRLGTKRTAFISLLLSCLCCLLSPLFFSIDSSVLFIMLLMFWGVVVITDSPLFSTLVANNAIVESKGTALTIVNCLGFSVTIISIQMLNLLQGYLKPEYIYTVLAIGPIIGLFALNNNKSTLENR